jgi:hypothetical protein
VINCINLAMKRKSSKKGMKKDYKLDYDLTMEQLGLLLLVIGMSTDWASYGMHLRLGLVSPVETR